MRLLNTITQTLFFLSTSTLLLAQTTVKEKDYTLKYSTYKIRIQFDYTITATKKYACGLGKISIFKAGTTVLDKRIGETIIGWFEGKVTP